MPNAVLSTGTGECAAWAVAISLRGKELCYNVRSKDVNVKGKENADC